MIIPVITVLMPVYNAELYIGKAVESILDQTFSDFEFIIINDGSTDNSEQIILSFNDSRINYINHVTNKGLISTLNEGINIAKGKYIARMDNDDISVSTRLERQFKFMEENTEIDILGSWFSLIGTDIIKILPVNDAECKVMLLQNNVFGHPTIFLRKDSLLNHGLKYNSSCLHAEDYRLWIDSAIAGLKFANLPEVLLHYRAYPGQTSELMRDIQYGTANDVRLLYGEYFFKDLIATNKEFYFELLDAKINKFESYLWARNFVKKALLSNKHNNYLDNSYLTALFDKLLDSCAQYQYSLWKGFSLGAILGSLFDIRFHKYLSVKNRIKFLLRSFLEIFARSVLI